MVSRASNIQAAKERISSASPRSAGVATLLDSEVLDESAAKVRRTIREWIETRLSHEERVVIDTVYAPGGSVQAAAEALDIDWRGARELLLMAMIHLKKYADEAVRTDPDFARIEAFLPPV